MTRSTRHIALGGLGVALLAAVALVAALLTYPRAITTWGTRVALQSDLDERTFEHELGDITYFEGGEGPPLVFVHGISDQAGSWFRVVDRFTDDYTVVVVDLPGHGESSFRGDDVLGDDSMEMLFGWLDDRFDEPATLVGNSLGGWISLSYALDHPERVDRVVPVGSGGLEHQIDESLLIPEDREDARRTVHTIFGDDAPPVPGFVLDRIVERSGQSIVQRAFDNEDDAEYLDDRLVDLQVPADLIWGTEDLIFPINYAERMDEIIPRSRLHVIDGCGHAPQVGCPDDLAELIDEILADDPPTGPSRVETSG